MKKQYISPEALVFECKANAVLMASANLDSLIDADPLVDDMTITPVDDILPETPSEDNVFNALITDGDF